jgi:TRAP transporter 4TM/12TM fusion protein
MGTIRRFGLGGVISGLAVLMVAYQLFYARTLILDSWNNQNVHLTFTLVLLFLAGLRKGSKLKVVSLVLLVVSVAATSYIFFSKTRLMDHPGVLRTWDTVVAMVLVAVCIEACRRRVGLVIPVLTLLLIGYVFLGHLVPGPLWHAKISADTAAASFAMAFSGIYGSVLAISADYLFLLIVFGSLLMAAGSGSFFLELGKLAGRRFRGGAGIAAATSSALFGTISGSGMADVVVTGTFTIPMMRSVGYSAVQAAGIETTASTGALLVPPVMGAAAFVMSQFLGIPYIQVAAMAILPAILYYLCLGIYIQLSAVKMKVGRFTEKVLYRELALAAPVFLVPAGSIVGLLVLGYSLRTVAFVVICETLGIIVLRMVLARKSLRESLKLIVKTLEEGVDTALTVAISCAVLGVVLACFDLTGLALRLPLLVESWAHGSQFLALVLVWAITTLLGMGIPPFAVYITAAMLMVPALVKLGVPLLGAHWFILIGSAFAQITPPVAPTAIAAAPIAGAPYLRTCVEALKSGFAVGLLPFFVLWAPVLILQPQAPLDAIVKIAVILVLIFFGQVAFVGQYLSRVGALGRVAAGLTTVLLVAFCGTTNYLLLAAGLALGIGLTGLQLRGRRSLTPSPPEVAVVDDQH